MRRLGNTLWAALAALSLILAAAVGALALRAHGSGDRSDVVGYACEAWDVGLASGEGGCAARFDRGPFRSLHLDGFDFSPRARVTTLQYVDFGMGAAHDSGARFGGARFGWGDRTAFAVVPHAAIAAASLLPPAAWGVDRLGSRWVRARRRRAGRCAACGYDLRASPGPCPECGAAAAAKPVA